MSSIWSKAFFGGLKPKPKLSVSEWADMYRVIPAGTSPEPGQWQTSRIPYAREILDCFSENKHKYIAFIAGSQLGKSEILLSVLGYFIHQDPSPILMIQPTEGTAEEFSKVRITPLIKETPVLANLMHFGNEEKGTGSSRKSDNTIMMKNYPGGYLALAGSNAPSGLASKPIRVLLMDEVDRFAVSAGNEGSPIKLGIQRTANFHNKKIALVSTPTIDGVSNIQEWFEKSDKRYYHVPCPDCEHKFIMKWEYMKWHKDADGNAVPSTAYIECPACGFNIIEHYKRNMLANGQWVKTAKSEVAGFHISSIYSPWVKFSELVAEFVEATTNNDKKGLQEFVNLKLGEVWQDSTGQIDIDYIERRREYYDYELPEKVLCITAGVDTQDDRLAVQFIGWGEGKESWILEYKEIMGDPSQNSTWQQLDDQLKRIFSFNDGRQLTVSSTCIDSGGHYTDEVYNFVKTREQMRIFAIKGRGGAGLPIAGNFSRSNRKQVALFTLGVDTAKEVIYQRLKIEFAGAGYVHFPRELERGCDENYFKMLLSERRVLKFEKGIKKWLWQKVFKRNEGLDTFVYALAALEILNPNFEVLKQRILAMPRSQAITHHMTANTAPRRRVLSSGIRV
jgi:phage terminase large subunit GpA-like protein